MNPYGEHWFHQNWSEELKLVANFGWMLSLMRPCDITAFFINADWLVGSRTALSGHDLLHFYIVGCTKLPYAVKAWKPWMRVPGAPVVSEGGPFERNAINSTAPRSAFEFASCVCEFAKALSGVPAVWEHKQLQTGTQNVLFGPRTFLQKVGMLESRDGSVAEARVGLGKNGSNCVDVFCNDHKWKELVAVADRFNDKHVGGLALPKDIAGTHAFVNSVVEFLLDFPKSFGHGQILNCDTSKAQYVFKNILRKILLWVQSRTPSDIWAEWTMKEIRACTPDTRALVTSLPPEMSAEKVRKVFGVDAFMLSCWTCLFHFVPKKKKAGLQERFADEAAQLGA